MSTPPVNQPFLKKYKPSKVFPPAITLEDVPETIPYTPNAGLPKNGIHIGQRKLALSEIQFLTENPCKYVVYAGSSPSNKIYFISQLFPNTRFILVDPRNPEIFIDDERTIYDPQSASISKSVHKKFRVLDSESSSDNMVDIITSSNDTRIFTIKGYFNNELAGKLAPLGANFISDIRSISERHSAGPRDIDVLWNMAQQYNWMRIMEPPVSCVKFRQVFYDSDAMDFLFANIHKKFYKSVFEKFNEYDLDFIEDYKNKKLRYPRGKIYLQAFPGPSSTETRLHIRAEDLHNIHDYDLQDYEDRLNFYNSYYRTYTLHENPFVNKTLCTDNCNDCAIEAVIWQNYIKSSKKPKKALDLIKKLGLYSKPLCDHGWHGNLTSADNIRANLKDNLKERQSKEGGDANMNSVSDVTVNYVLIVILTLLILLIYCICRACNKKRITESMHYRFFAGQQRNSDSA